MRAVRRAFKLLNLFDATRPLATLSDLSRESALPISTVQRLVQTLEREGCLARQADGSYALGGAIVRLGLAAINAMPLHARAASWLDDLSASTGETANLAVPEASGRAMYLRQSASTQALRHENWLGKPFDCKHTAVGRALLGKVDAEGGYITRHTQTPDISASSAPILNEYQQIIGALSVTAPTVRTDDDKLEYMRVQVVRAAAGLTLAIGGHWPYASPTQ